MKVLVLNSGSSSLKYQLFDVQEEKVLTKGLIERIGLDDKVPNHEAAIATVLGLITDKIDAVGHRVAHGGNLFKGSVIIDEEIKLKIKSLFELAPLHNPPALMGIEACEKILPETKQVAVFDTAFHQSMPEYAFLYGLPYEMFEKYGIRKYGFHGTSHKYVAERAASMLGKNINETKIITCHLGNGASITAVNNGKSIETSMGFTPLEGLMMGTRSGDIDPAIVAFLMRKENWNTEEVSDFLNKECGVLGVSGVSSDFRDVENAAAKGNHRAQLAIDIFNHDVLKYIGAYAAVLNGVDAIVFTAGLGENSSAMRSAVCKNLGYLGVTIDDEKNILRGKEVMISTPQSMTQVMVIPTNEELMIARDTAELITKG